MSDTLLTRAHLRSLPEGDGYQLMLGLAAADAPYPQEWIAAVLPVGLDRAHVAARLRMLADNIERAA